MGWWVTLTVAPRGRKAVTPDDVVVCNPDCHCQLSKEPKRPRDRKHDAARKAICTSVHVSWLAFLLYESKDDDELNHGTR